MIRPATALPRSVAPVVGTIAVGYPRQSKTRLVDIKAAGAAKRSQRTDIARLERSAMR